MKNQLLLKSMKIQTVQKTYTQKNGTIWEWEETPELRAYLAQIASKVVSESLNKKPEFINMAVQ